MRSCTSLRNCEAFNFPERTYCSFKILTRIIMFVAESLLLSLAQTSARTHAYSQLQTSFGLRKFKVFECKYCVVGHEHGRHVLGHLVLPDVQNQLGQIELPARRLLRRDECSDKLAFLRIRVAARGLRLATRPQPAPATAAGVRCVPLRRRAANALRQVSVRGDVLRSCPCVLFTSSMVLCTVINRESSMTHGSF